MKVPPTSTSTSLHAVQQDVPQEQFRVEQRSARIPKEHGHMSDWLVRNITPGAARCKFDCSWRARAPLLPPRKRAPRIPANGNHLEMGDGWWWEKSPGRRHPMKHETLAHLQQFPIFSYSFSTSYCFLHFFPSFFFLQNMLAATLVICSGCCISVCISTHSVRKLYNSG